jgi:ADP-ribose pyrophosphatase YjhB (NUDIX family)
MVKSAKLVSIRRHGRQILLVRRRKDKLWMFPGGRRKKRLGETPKACLRREIREELPDLHVGSFRRWVKLAGKNRYSGKRMSDAVFIAAAKGALKIGAPTEIDKAAWLSPWSAKLTPTSRLIRDKLASTGQVRRS